MTMIDKAPVARALSDFSRFRSTAPVPAVASMSPFLAPAPAAGEPAPVRRASDCGESAMRRLRHPFVSE
ncbi:hypothetical protein [Actinoplanes utahensis]|uniref:Uncharacterized protein n=1 Tax=Actinoplanes utahensis TaxID=1869 RepID=A0A0A6UP35_ACTUT|nr:hypothetical protein [Actinoplanes utahensis]KHD76803.1 hypothetical protein MB27_14735 [Actinoplanes utahensis]